MDPFLEALQRGLGDSFRVERELGGGGMSRVFLARDLSLDRRVVVKVLGVEASEATSSDRFRREVQLIARLQHPHIVPILAASQLDGLLSYVMPFVSGDTLRARLARERRRAPRHQAREHPARGGTGPRRRLRRGQRR